MEQTPIDLQELVNAGANSMTTGEDGTLSFRYRGKPCSVRTTDPLEAYSSFLKMKGERDDELARMPLTIRALEEAGLTKADYSIQSQFNAIVRDPRGRVRDSLVLAYNEKGYLAEVELLKKRLYD